MPNKPQEIPSNSPFHWHGLDETAILTAHSTAEITHLGYECNVPVLREYESQLARGISSLKYLEGNALVHYMTEEGKIEEDLFWIIEAVNRTPGRLVEFGRNLDYFRLGRGDSPALLSRGVQPDLFRLLHHPHFRKTETSQSGKSASFRRDRRPVFQH